MVLGHKAGQVVQAGNNLTSGYHKVGHKAGHAVQVEGRIQKSTRSWAV